jgi:isopenicillin-N N-acyltransferase-like protein
VRTYFRRFEEYGGVVPEEIRRRAAEYDRVIEARNPDYAVAMRGIAEGSGQDLLDIVALNVRYEVLYSEFARIGLDRERVLPSALGGCTSFAILPDQTTSGHLLVGQNWDWIPDAQGIVVRTKRAGGPSSLGFTEAGIMGAKIGLNEAGIALAINGLVSDQDSWKHMRTPFHVRCWEILASRDLPQALAAVRREVRACSANFLIAQAGGARVVDLEAAPDATCELAPEGGFLAHTNHFKDADRLGVRQPLGEDRKSTYHRYDRIHALLREALNGRCRIDLEDLKRILGDHEGGPLAICRHEDTTRPPHDRFETVVSVIMDVDEREMFLSSGNPCRTEYRRYTLA